MTTEYNPVGWFEIYVQDLARATKFYETVLGVQLEELPMPSPEMKIEMMSFPMVEKGNGAPGALVKMEGSPVGGNSTIVYFSSEDCANEQSRIVEAGGTVHTEKMSIGQYGFIVRAIDTEGNMFGVHSLK